MLCSILLFFLIIILFLLKNVGIYCTIKYEGDFFIKVKYMDNLELYKNLTGHTDVQFIEEINSALNVGIILEDPTRHKIVYVSDSLCDMLGFSYDDIISDNFSIVQLYHPDDRERVVREYAHQLRTGSFIHIEFRIRDSKNTYHAVQILGRIISEGKYAGMLACIYIDVSSYIYNTRSAAEQSNIVSEAFDILNDAPSVSSGISKLFAIVGPKFSLTKIHIFRIDLTEGSIEILHKWEFISSSLTEPNLTGKYTVNDVHQFLTLFGAKKLKVFHPNNIPQTTLKMHRQIEQLIGKSTLCGIINNSHGIYNVITYQTEASDRIWDKNELNALNELTKILGVYFNKDEALNEAEQRISRMMDYDPMTLLPTFQKFKQDTTQYLKDFPQKQMALIYADFLDFKNINHNYSYEAGDFILKQFASLLNSYTSFSDQFATRITNDEFAMLIPLGSKTPEELSDYNCELNRSFCSEMGRIYPMASIILRSGVYIIPKGNTNILTAIDMANTARKTLTNLKESKTKLFDDQLKYRLETETNISQTMRPALKNKEFKMYLQPKVDSKTKQIIGAEALVRWIHSDGSIVSPVAFIPYFERNGFITEVDLCILEQAFEFQELRLKNGQPLFPISVNLSRAEGKDYTFRQRLEEIINRFSEIDHEYIEFEITETAFADIESRFLDCIYSLRDAGFKINIDDFGSGYSSLSMLSELPVDIVKIDRTLLTNSKNSEKKSKILLLTINMIKSLGFEVLCEGAETKNEVDFLSNAGCNLIQGFYYSKPMPANEFDKFYTEFNTF